MPSPSSWPGMEPGRLQYLDGEAGGQLGTGALTVNTLSEGWGLSREVQVTVNELATLHELKGPVWSEVSLSQQKCMVWLETAWTWWGEQSVWGSDPTHVRANPELGGGRLSPLALTQPLLLSHPPLPFPALSHFLCGCHSYRDALQPGF